MKQREGRLYPYCVAVVVVAAAAALQWLFWPVIRRPRGPSTIALANVVPMSIVETIGMATPPGRKTG